ncbi:TPA: hypothetical protein DDW35_02695, partial [Candidatus Sumerlaeota bacterium]|nr:hypothetical protein [Candidatus Sumerlaeota bacterium]
IAQSKDGTVYKIKAGKSDNKNYIRLNVEYAQPVLTSADKETTATQAAAQEAATKAQKVAPELDKKFSHWVFEVSDQSFKALTKNRSELMEPIEKAEGKSEQDKPIIKKDAFKLGAKKDAKK